MANLLAASKCDIFCIGKALTIILVSSVIIRLENRSCILLHMKRCNKKKTKFLLLFLNHAGKQFTQHQQQNLESQQLLSIAALFTTLSLHRAKPSGSAVPAREQGIVGKRGMGWAHAHCYGPQWSSSGMKALQKFAEFHFPTAQAMTLSQDRDGASQCSPPKTKRGKRDRMRDGVKTRTSWVLVLFHVLNNLGGVEAAL